MLEGEIEHKDSCGNQVGAPASGGLGRPPPLHNPTAFPAPRTSAACVHQPAPPAAASCTPEGFLPPTTLQGVIGPGGVQWMTAGRGIIHSEMPRATDGMLWGFQLWINLPAKNKMDKPR